ncbi:MAG: AAA family ATPase [Thermofilaceae archaeon]
MAQAVDRRRKQVVEEPSSTAHVAPGARVFARQPVISPRYSEIRARDDTTMGTIAFTPNAVKELVKHYYWMLYRGSPVPSLLLIGPPGVGKSTAVKEVADEIAKQLDRTFIDVTDKNHRDRVYREIMECAKTKDLSTCLSERNYFLFMDLRLTEVEPVDLVGYPYREEGRMEYSPPAWALLFSWFPGILFLDELSNVRREDVMAAAYKLLLDKAAGFTKFHRDVLVVAAGNLPEHAPGIAQPLPPPVVNRTSLLFVSAPSVEDWYEWMISKISRFSDDLRSELLETLNFIYLHLLSNRGDFFNLEEAKSSMKGENFPSPRSWSHLVFSYPMSVLRSLVNQPEALIGALSSFVGPTVAQKLAVAVSRYTVVPYKDILADPDALDRYLESLGKDASMALIYLVAGLPMRILEFKPSPDVVRRIAEKVYSNGAKYAGDPGFACTLVEALGVALSKLPHALKLNDSDRAYVTAVATAVSEVWSSAGCRPDNVLMRIARKRAGALGSGARK